MPANAMTPMRASGWLSINRVAMLFATLSRLGVTSLHSIESEVSIVKRMLRVWILSLRTIFPEYGRAMAIMMRARAASESP